MESVSSFKTTLDLKSFETNTPVSITISAIWVPPRTDVIIKCVGCLG